MVPFVLWVDPYGEWKELLRLASQDVFELWEDFATLPDEVIDKMQIEFHSDPVQEASRH